MLGLRPYQRRALTDIETAEREGVRRPLLVFPTGTGKGHPGHTDVLTPTGWRKWGNLEVGDRVYGSVGTPITVTSIHDRGVLPVYRVTFSDGAQVEVDADHLWTVQDYRYRRTSREYRTVSTREVMSEGLTVGKSRRWAVPLVVMMHSIGSPDLPIDPYTLGSLIANGSMIGSGTQLTTPDEAVIARIRRSERHEVRTGKLSHDGQCPRYSLPGLSGRIRSLGLDVHSRDKFIPREYLLAGVVDRTALFQGLMDGDGSSRDGRRTVNYCTTSPRLAEDVRHLVMSIGGTATIETHERNRDGATYLDITVHIMVPVGTEPFSTPRKTDRPSPKRTFEPRRTIVAIDRVEDQSIRCITVSAPDHLYVVGRDFIVTHNTVIFSHALKERAEKGRGLVLVHREELAEQTRDKLAMVAPELSTGIVKAERNELDADVVIASVQTVSRDKRLADLAYSGRERPFGTIVVDEAHHAPAPTWNKVLTGMGAYSAFGPLTIGFTATPERDNGKTLGVWEKVVSYMSIREAIYGDRKKGEEGGYLVPILPAVVVETKMDLDRVRKTGGDYSDGDLGTALEEAGAIEQIADAYRDHAADRKGVAFTPTVATAHRLASEMTKRGIVAEAVDGGTDPELRRAILRRLKTGATQVVVNCAVLTEGFDEPSVSCVVVARPTKFHGLYVQMVGRGTRLYPGKRNLMVLDVVGASNRHELVGLVDLGLDMDDPRKKPTEPSERMQCPTCESPDCGFPEWHRCKLCNRYLPVSITAKEGTRHENCQAVTGGRIDVFGTSRLRWLPLPDGAYCLGAGKEVVVMVPVGEDTWKLAAYEGHRLTVIQKELPADWAMGIGEDRAKAFQKLAERDARWLKGPASDSQKSRLIREGFPAEHLPRVRTKGDAADLITRIIGRRAVRKLVR